MTISDRLSTKFPSGKTTTEEALDFFDELDSVDLEFMLGRWKGRGFDTNHPLDGLLETCGWYGKEFIDAETVHPLLFLNSRDRIIRVDPNPVITDLGCVFLHQLTKLFSLY